MNECDGCGDLISRSNSGGSSGSGSGGEGFPIVFHRRRKGGDGTRAGNTAYSVSPTSFDTICAVCQKPVIEDRTSVRTLEGSILHRECFCCSTCGKPLEIKNDAGAGIDEIIEGGNVPTYGTDLNGKYFCNEHLRSSKPSSIEYKEIKSGYLFKQGRVVKNWKYRFFVLLADMKQLRYYQRDTDDVPRNDDLSVTSSSSSLSSSTSSATTFSLLKEDTHQHQHQSQQQQQQQQYTFSGTPQCQQQRSAPISIRSGKATSLESSPGGTESSSYDSPPTTGSPLGRRGFVQASPKKPQKTTKNRGFIDLGEVTDVVPASFSLRGVSGCPDGSCPGFQILARDRVWNLVCLDESERSLWINAIKYVISLPTQQQTGRRRKILTQLFG